MTTKNCLISAQSDGWWQIRFTSWSKGYLFPEMAGRGLTLHWIGPHTGCAVQSARLPLADDDRHDDRVYGGESRLPARTRRLTFTLRPWTITKILCSNSRNTRHSKILASLIRSFIHSKTFLTELHFKHLLCKLYTKHLKPLKHQCCPH